MKADFLRLDCRIQRWNTTQPAVFLIDTTQTSLPTAVYNRDTLESMDSIRGQRPRPLKTHAYSFNRIQDERGGVIVEKRAANSAMANDFVRRILAAAEPIDERAYLEDLDRVIWPVQAEIEYSGSSGPLRAVDLRRAPRGESAGMMGLDYILQKSQLDAREELCAFQALPDSGPSTKKGLLLQLTDIISRMDEEDLEALLKLARTLKEA